MPNPTIKTKAEIAVMREGGKKLARVRAALKAAVKVGASGKELEDFATKMIKEEGGESSFKMVSGYDWSICLNVNEGVVHGIPHPEIVFTEGDIVSVDVGMFYKGFHTDTSFTVLLGEDQKKQKFLEIGKAALGKAINQAKAGKKVGDISRAMEEELKKHALAPITNLTGHGIGKELHEAPPIPCFVSGSYEENVKIEVGMTLAIEIMYAEGTGNIELSSDGWTLSTKDGKLAALFEETVAVTDDGPIILTTEKNTFDDMISEA